jgi:hypothetical protein
MEGVCPPVLPQGKRIKRYADLAEVVYGIITQCDNGMCDLFEVVAVESAAS